jgi:hypothetical protein
MRRCRAPHRYVRPPVSLPPAHNTTQLQHTSTHNNTQRHTTPFPPLLWVSLSYPLELLINLIALVYLLGLVAVTFFGKGALDKAKPLAALVVTAVQAQLAKQKRD